MGGFQCFRTNLLHGHKLRTDKKGPGRCLNADGPLEPATLVFPSAALGRRATLPLAYQVDLSTQ